jgi:hypothetical protein
MENFLLGLVGLAFANGGPVRVESNPVIHAIPLNSDNVHILSEELKFEIT